MAGTTKTIQREWPKTAATESASTVKISALEQFYTQINNLVTDDETMRGVLAASNILIEELFDDHATFKAVVDELKLDYTALLADVTANRAEVVKLVTDMGTRISEHNTLATKLNNDAGVTDTNYAAAAAITAAAPAAITATAIATSAPATLTATKPTSSAVNAAGDLVASALSVRY